MLLFNGYCYSRIWSWYEEPCLERRLVVCPGEKAALLSTNHTFIRIYSKVLKGFCQNNLWEVDLNWKINRHECCFLLFPRFLAPWNIYWILTIQDKTETISFDKPLPFILQLLVYLNHSTVFLFHEQPTGDEFECY